MWNQAVYKQLPGEVSTSVLCPMASLGLNGLTVNDEKALDVKNYLFLQNFSRIVVPPFEGHLAHWNQECPQLFWL